MEQQKVINIINFFFTMPTDDEVDKMSESPLFLLSNFKEFIFLLYNIIYVKIANDCKQMTGSLF